MTRVLIISHEAVGARMAAPAIRFWEMAKVLGGEFDVTLASPPAPSPPRGGTSVLQPGRFEVLSYTLDHPASWAVLETACRERADVVVASGHLVQQLPFLQDLTVPFVADMWIPMPVESIAWHAFSGREKQLSIHRHLWQVTRLIARHTDWLMCASERQRDLWLGIYAAHGRLHPDRYAEDADLRNLIDTVPFGCPSDPPLPGRAIKGVWPGISADDRVILWGSGVWNWFDPLTVLRAMPEVLAAHPKARLAFIGVKHPDSRRVPEMESARRARALSDELGLTGQAAFWGDWIPYADRGAYLLEADLGVSLHLTGLEARFAFRARLLDSLWAGLPMVLTRGDVLSQEFEKQHLGMVVDAQDVEGCARAMIALLDASPAERATRRTAFDQVRPQYHWEQVVEPLVRFCRAPRRDPGKLDPPDTAGTYTGAAQAEITRLQTLVRGYESGRVMRLLAALHRARQRILR